MYLGDVNMTDDCVDIRCPAGTQIETKSFTAVTYPIMLNGDIRTYLCENSWSGSITITCTCAIPVCNAGREHIILSLVMQ